MQQRGSLPISKKSESAFCHLSCVFGGWSWSNKQMPIHPFHSVPFHSIPFIFIQLHIHRQDSVWPSKPFKSHAPFPNNWSLLMVNILSVNWEHASHWQRSESGTREKRRNEEARCQAKTNHRCAASRSAREESKQNAKVEEEEETKTPKTTILKWCGMQLSKSQRQCKPKATVVAPHPQTLVACPLHTSDTNEPYLRRSTDVKPFLDGTKLPTSASSVEVVTGSVTTIIGVLSRFEGVVATDCHRYTYQ